MFTGQKNGIPLKEGFWTNPSSGKQPQLIGSKCDECGELFFPKKDSGWCIHCNKKSLNDVLLSRIGKIASFSVVMQQPAGGFYKGPVPYSYGCVDLPEGIRIETLFSTEDFSDLEVGKYAEFIIEKLCDDEGKEILTFKFRPISK